MSAPARNGAEGPDIETFEALAFDPEAFDHTAHLYVAWLYLRDGDLLQAIERYRATLRKLTTRLGIAEKYHESVTWFFLIAVAERMNGQAHDDWSRFKADNEDMFRSGRQFLGRFYSDELLSSERAKRSFCLPDRRESLPAA